MSEIKIESQKFIEAGEKLTLLLEVNYKEYELNMSGELETLSRYLENFSRFSSILGKYTEMVIADMERNKQAVLAMVEVDEKLITEKE